MRIENLIELAKSSLKLGIYVCGAVVLLYIFGYLLLYRVYLLGKKKIPVIYVLWAMIMCWYVAVIVNVTLVGRNAIFVQKMRPLFSSYREAWYTASVTDWRNIILNYCLFIPLGVWLPIGIKFFRKMHWVGIAALVLSTIIEIIQVVRKTGVFEVDDILGNVIGSLIGFGFWGLAFYIIIRKKNPKEWKLSRVLALQIPLIALMLAYICLVIVYNAKELGNNSYSFYYGYDPEILNITSDIEFDNEKRTIPIYKAPILSLEGARKFADDLSGRFDVNGYSKKEDIFENKIIVRYPSVETGDIKMASGISSGQHISTCFVYYRGALYDFGVNRGRGKNLVVEHKNGIATTYEVIQENGEALSKEILLEYGEEVPDGYEYSIWKKTKYVYTYNFVPYEGKYLYGTLSYRPDIESIENHVMKCDYAGEYEMISMAEAYRKITEGKFGRKHENIDRKEDRLDIRITGCELIYELDSKGYLQPDYEFSCMINGRENKIIIPALK